MKINILPCGAEQVSLTKIGDGKLNREFYFIFMAELIRDYFVYFNSFNDGNIASLLQGRKNTLPIKPAEISTLLQISL